MRTLLLVFALVVAGSAVSARQLGFDRLPSAVLDVVAPSARVAGPPGRMTIREAGCRALPAAEVRRRIVELSVQEWAYFGFALVDRSDDEDGEAGPTPAAGPVVGVGSGAGTRSRRGWRRAGGPEAARVADSIAGYWAVAPGGAWILENQNAIWNRPGDAMSRWRYPWSAAFISWVMCESGLASADQFQRAIAHHSYIDQAIRRRDGGAPRAAFTAYEQGEAEISVGDLLCTARRPAYRTLADRRRQMGVGARTHCDVVVKVDEAAGRVLAIGGNVRGTVGLKVLPAVRSGSPARLRIANPPEDSGARAIFAHLKLAASYGGAGSFDTTRTLQALGCATEPAIPAWRAAAAVVAPSRPSCAG